jgi:predicted ABC-type transport system involved in lysophospholipase L1 biosynthesis ATPase subunit
MMKAVNSHQALLQAEGIHKAYRSGDRDISVLHGLSLTLASRETVSVAGESGSGKSTLLNILAGIEVPDRGTVTWKGAPIGTLEDPRLPAQRARFLGFVFQSYYLVPELNTLENVLLAARIAGQPMREARERARDLLVETGLGDRLQSRPEHLSGGERQRAALARALINSPEVLLADEPTGNLDERTAGRVMEMLLETARRHHTGLILVTHNPHFAGLTGRQLVLEEGQLAEPAGRD